MAYLGMPAPSPSRPYRLRSTSFISPKENVKALGVLILEFVILFAPLWEPPGFSVDSGLEKDQAGLGDP